MKIIYIFSALLSFGMLFPSCTKEEVVIPNKTIFVDVTPDMWELVPASNTYQVAIDMPELDTYASDANSVQVDLSFNDGASYEALPQVYGGVTYLYSYGPGTLYLDVQTADGVEPVRLNSTILVKIVLIASQY